ncbi:MAG TPA: flagellar type III secretion system pore protein FliP [Terriglobales bacterium]|jgi:type III secretion protein R|nr:flagellar type III secretion system pore protein FliP [Terriglobales bacterium]
MKRFLYLAILLFPHVAHAQGGNQMSNPIVMVIVLGALSLAPFVLVMLTSFVKISVVLSILRNALGTQQVPPNQIITGLAFVLSLFIMVPVARQMYDAAGSVSNTKDIFSEASVKSLYDASTKAKEPLRWFLSGHSQIKDRQLFMDLAARLELSAAKRKQANTAKPAAPATPAPVQAATTAPPTDAAPSVPPPPKPEALNIAKPDKEDFQVLMPAFVTSQLKEAFEVGFLLFVPFIVVDMVVANILLAMGMQMLSPTVISLPFKLLLFVLVDGWFLIIRGLVLSYT